MSAEDNDSQSRIQELMPPRSQAGVPQVKSRQEVQPNLPCCQDVDIPPELPGILKAYAKSAITTQPKDLLHWSAAYFRSMSKGDIPPVKDRLEFPVNPAPNGLTKGLIRLLNKQLGGKKRCNFALLKPKWTDICLSPADAQKLLENNGLDPGDFSWTQFIAAAAASLGNGGISDIMDTVCFSMAQTIPNKDESSIPLEDFLEAYTFLANRFNIENQDVEAASNFLKERARGNANLVGPKDFNDPGCPLLQGKPQ